MKEVTYEEWQKNPTPRMMWVWDNDAKNKEKRKVVYVLNNDYTYRVLSSADDDSNHETFYGTFKHCAEIEKQRRMTHKELSRWLREHPSREYKHQTSDYIYGAFNYRECKQDEKVHEDIRIREDDGEWREPLVEE